MQKDLCQRERVICVNEAFVNSIAGFEFPPVRTTLYV